MSGTNKPIPSPRVRRPARPVANAMEIAGQERWIVRPERKTRVKVNVLEGTLKGSTLLFDRPCPEEWTTPKGERYSVVDVGHARYAVHAPDEGEALPFIAWRGWRLMRTLEGWRLASEQTREVQWPGGGPLVATCDRQKHGSSCAQQAGVSRSCACPPFHAGAPALECYCGIYCTKTLGDLEDAGHEHDHAIGLLAGWGRWIEHDFGFRFERVHPLAIVVAPSSAWIQTVSAHSSDPRDILRLVVADLRKTYRVPVGSCSPNVALEKMVGLVARAGLPEWTQRALPPDIRVAAALLETWKEKANGG